MYRFYRYKTERPYYSETHKFYVCSYGGCGSQMLCHYLGHFGDVYHLHSREPPPKLTNTGYDDNKTYAEWFSYNEIPEADLYKYTVIFLYRNPVDAIYSRYIDSPAMLKNVQCADANVTVADCLRVNQDLFGLAEFFDNYTIPSQPARNYPIYCVKYEDFWANIPRFNETFALPDIPALYPVKNEREQKTKAGDRSLADLYSGLNAKMQQMAFIEKR
jgi:hypothetical protein